MPSVSANLRATLLTLGLLLAVGGAATVGFAWPDTSPSGEPQGSKVGVGLGFAMAIAAEVVLVITLGRDSTLHEE